MAEGRELAWRLTLGPVLIVALAALFFADARAGDTAPWLLVLTLVLVIRSVWELGELLSTRAAQPDTVLVAICAVIVVAANWVPAWQATADRGTIGIGRLGPALLALALAIMALFGNALVRYRGPGNNLERLGLEILALSYVAILTSATVQLRWIAGPGLPYLPLASLVVVTKCADTAAYFTGHAIGGRKLSPLISPGKTVAGALGALLGGALGGALCLSVAPRWFAPEAQPAAWHWSLLYGLIVSTVGIVGDLSESLLKRDVGRKDSAPLLPGFGGVLDLLDSVIFTGPVAYLLWIVLPLPR